MAQVFRRTVTVKFILKASIIFCYYHVCALATTNIMRLLKGSTLHVYDSTCKCPYCGGRITVLMQMPIFSYLILRGKCRYCGAPIPVRGLILECSVFLGMTAITIALHFSVFGILLSFLYYEGVRIVCFILFGRREDSFFSQYLLAILSILFICGLMVLLSFLLTA